MLHSCLLFQDSVTIGIEQLAQIINLLTELSSLVCISHKHTMGRQLNKLCCRLDVLPSLNSISDIHKWFMLNKLETAAMVNQCISCNTRFLMISLRESSVNHHQFAIGLDGIFTLRGMNGNVAIDDMAIVASNAEGIENTVELEPIQDEYEEDKRLSR